MRRVLLGDLLALAAMVRGSEDQALGLILCDQAHVAHVFTKRTGRLHFPWGNGSLMSRAQGQLLNDWSDGGLMALETAARSLRHWRALQSGAALDCRPGALCATVAPNMGALHGRDSDQTQHHRPGLGAPVSRSQ